MSPEKNLVFFSRQAAQAATRANRKGQLRSAFSHCATRAFTNFLISAVGNALSVGNWIVPFEVVNPASSSLNSSITDAVGNKLQCSENAAYHTSTFFVLNAGIW